MTEVRFWVFQMNCSIPVHSSKAVDNKSHAGRFILWHPSASYCMTVMSLRLCTIVWFLINVHMYNFRLYCTLQCRTRSSAAAEIALVRGHYAVQGHSRSALSVPIESPYATSYCWIRLTYIISCTISTCYWTTALFTASLMVKYPRESNRSYGFRQNSTGCCLLYTSPSPRD